MCTALLWLGQDARGTRVRQALHESGSPMPPLSLPLSMQPQPAPKSTATLTFAATQVGFRVVCTVPPLWRTKR